MLFSKPPLPRPAPAPQIPRPIPARQPNTLFIEPNQRGGLSLRWSGDEEQLGNFASVADATRVAEFNFADVVVVGPAPTNSAL